MNAFTVEGVDAVQRFAELVAAPGVRLDEAALAIAAGAAADLDPARWLGELDRLASGIDSLDTLIHRLFVEEGFAGNTEHYYDPRNSLLPEVLTRRLGIPITLSVVCLEVGRRAGIALEGVGMPGHFLVRPVGTQRYLDAFASGQLLDLAGCEARFRASTGAGPDIPFGPNLLTTTPTPAILARILENLRAVYRGAGNASDLEWVLRMRLALPGVGAAELVEVSQAMTQQGRWLDAVRFLESQVDTWPQHADLLGRSARSLRARLN